MVREMPALEYIGYLEKCSGGKPRAGQPSIGNALAKWQQRFFKLADDGLLKYYKSSCSQSPLGVLDVNGGSLEQSEFLLVLTTSDRTLTLRAADAEDAAGWYCAIALFVNHGTVGCAVTLPASWVAAAKAKTAAAREKAAARARVAVAAAARARVMATTPSCSTLAMPPLPTLAAAPRAGAEPAATSAERGAQALVELVADDFPLLPMLRRDAAKIRAAKAAEMQAETDGEGGGLVTSPVLFDHVPGTRAPDAPTPRSEHGGRRGPAYGE